MEGEEESGSDNFEPWIVANRDRLGADLALISDTGFFEGNIPAITINPMPIHALDEEAPEKKRSAMDSLSSSERMKPQQAR